MLGAYIVTLVDRFSEGCGLFEFDIATPLFQQLSSDFDLLAPVPLMEGNLHSVEEKPGIYGLHHDGVVVYIGKADDSAKGRLEKHRRQLQGRTGISSDEVSFRCLHFARTWDTFKPESYLISHYSPSWNKRGFGPNDPGRRRDKTSLASDHWHVLYPIDPEYQCAQIPSGCYDILELLRLVCRHAPYWIRFQGNRNGDTDEERMLYEEAHADFLASREIVIKEGGMSVRSLLLLAIQSLPKPSEWQLTLLPSHILLYRERDEAYPRMQLLWPPSITT
jgi:hypothetical protein